MVSLLRKEQGKFPENQEREIIISQNSSRNIPEKKNLNVWLKLSWMKYTAEIRSSHIWKEVSTKVPTREIRENAQEEKYKETRLKLRLLTYDDGQSPKGPCRY